MKRKRDHKTEKRPREIQESFCAEPKCKFYGKHAQQLRQAGHVINATRGSGGVWTYTLEQPQPHQLTLIG